MNLASPSRIYFYQNRIPSSHNPVPLTNVCGAVVARVEMGIITNPILPGFNPDTSITYVPGVGYVICTSSFEFWPALPIYHSTDLTSWKLVGHALNRREQGVDLRNLENSAGLWAPTIRYHKGRVYVACTSVNREWFDLSILKACERWIDKAAPFIGFLPPFGMASLVSESRRWLMSSAHMSCLHLLRARSTCPGASLSRRMTSWMIVPGATPCL